MEFPFFPLRRITETRLARAKQRPIARVDGVMNVGDLEVPVCALGRIEHLDAAPTRLGIDYLPKCIVIFWRSKGGRGGGA
ncbi:hypothetical protein ACQUJZ_02310 [Ralstonia pseudosolanacearum]